MVTYEEMEAAKSPRGGWTRKTLAGWGVPWPPPSGWRRQLLKGQKNPKARTLKGELQVTLPAGPVLVEGTWVYTDGSCWPNPGPGAWAYVAPSLGVEKSGFEANTTNNRMEMMAIIEAMKGTTGPLTIVTDSQLCIGAFAKGWKCKANLDLVHEGRSLMVGRQVEFRWVKGHSGHVHNERADELAEQARFMGQESTAAPNPDTFDWRTL